MEPKQVKGLLLSALMIAVTSTGSSQRIWETRKGCIRSQGNIGGGYLFTQKAPSAYLNGEMELFFEDRVAYTGAISYSFATNRKNETGLKANHAIFSGANFHFLKPKRWDPYVGLTPGIGLVRAAYRSNDQLKMTPYSLVPLISAQVGCNYYVVSFLHFFVKVQGVSGQMFSTLPEAQRIDELKFMAGLGWNLRLWKPKKKDVWREKKTG